MSADRPPLMSRPACRPRRRGLALMEALVAVLLELEIDSMSLDAIVVAGDVVGGPRVSDVLEVEPGAPDHGCLRGWRSGDQTSGGS